MTVALVAGGAAGVSFSGGLGLLLAELQLKLPELQAKLDTSLNLTANLQANLVDPTALIQAALAFSADASAAVALSVPELVANLNVGLSAQLDASASLAADLGELTLRIELLQLQIAALAGVFVYLYTGPPAQLGNEVGARVAADISAPGVVAPVLVATTPAASVALRSAIGL